MPELFLLKDNPQPILEGKSSAAGRLRTQVERIARTPRTTVLLVGQRGRELELVARSIHLHAKGRGAFLPVSAQALSASARQVDVFGCAGGLCERARGGTLFLDEVSELKDELQAHLLRSLEERLHGAEREASVEVQEPRIVASTALDLESLVQGGQFRSDLLYRLNVLTIRVPSLGERSEDLEHFAKHILLQQGRRIGLRARLAPEALMRLKQYPWPGNLLELEAVLTQALLHCQGGTIQAEGLQLGQSQPAEAVPSASLKPMRSIRASEEALIRRVLLEEAGNRSSAARALGINRTTLYNKLRQYGIA